MKEIFSKRLKELRLKFKLTQNELAERCKMSQQVINKYEHQLQMPRLENLIDIANALNTTIDYLCGISDIESSMEKDKIFKDSYTSKEIAKAILILIESNYFEIKENTLTSNEKTILNYLQAIQDIKAIEKNLKNIKSSSKYCDTKQMLLDNANSSNINHSEDSWIPFEIIDSNKKNTHH